MLDNYDSYKRYFEIIRYALDPVDMPVSNTKNIDWGNLYHFSQEQAIAGIVFRAVELLNDKRIDKRLLLHWFATAEQIKTQNKILNKKSALVVDEYKKEGFECCILKGQGNAILYPCGYLRSPGDIDVYVKDANRKQLLQYMKRAGKRITGMHFQHIEYEEEGVPIEIHLMPCSDNNPVYHKRLQKWFKEHSATIWNNRIELPSEAGAITAPDKEFNIIYQLAHMKGHFFDEGIGLRQMMDYYLLLNNYSGNIFELKDDLRFLGLDRFAGAVMFVLQEVFDLHSNKMIVPVDARRGELLLNEIISGGNFGKQSGITNHAKLSKFILKTRRNLSFARYYPSEAFCEPFFRLWHYLWRMAHRG